MPREATQKLPAHAESLATTAAETAEDPPESRVSKKLSLKSQEGAPVCATMTDHTSNSIKEHIEQTLRMRLGTTRKMVTGQELYDAVVALGLTRYSQSDVNAVVNKLAAFVRLRFETTDKKPPTRMQHSGTLSRMIGLQHMTTGATQSLEVTVDERSKAIWEWPHDGVASMADFLRGNVSEGNWINVRDP